MQKKVFNEQDMIVHQLSRSLQTALIDKKLSPQETQLLAPQFEMYLQKFNARVEFSPDGDINKTKIVKRSGDTVDILKFAQDMQMLDPVMKGYESFLAQRQAKANVALLAAAEADLKRREQRAKTLKAEQEAGIAPGESTGSGMEEATRPLTKNEQNKYVKIYGADFLTLPNDVQANIKQVENAIDKEAEDLGLIAQDEKGNYVMPDAAKIKNMQDRVKWARKNLPAFKDMAEKERDIYADNGMEDIAGNGRWNLLVKNLSAVDTLYKAKERNERITANKKDLENVAKAVKKQPWYLRGFGMGAVNQAQQGTAFAKFFNDNKGKASEKEANATKRKIEKNRAARKNKQ
ncbi:MAG: hypothetical protein J6W00_10420 [Lentisphaeria bacterium]|nr:hypothetical protein [Lentisphaeria bacterium]